MSAMQRNFVPNQQFNQQLQQQQDQQQPQPQKPRYRFRWPIYIGIPLAVVVYLWFIRGMEVTFTYADIMRRLRVVSTDRYILLTCLGITCVTILLIAKAFKKNN